MTATLQSAEQAVMALTAYGLEKQLITSDDIYYTANTLFDIMHMEPEEDPAAGGYPSLSSGRCRAARHLR